MEPLPQLVDELRLGGVDGSCFKAAATGVCVKLFPRWRDVDPDDVKVVLAEGAFALRAS